jgi:hypothetical protein
VTAGFELGQLSELLADLVGELADGHGIEIKPVFEFGRVVGGLEVSHANSVVAWEISFVTPKGEFAYRRETVAVAVEAARADAPAWR